MSKGRIIHPTKEDLTYADKYSKGMSLEQERKGIKRHKKILKRAKKERRKEQEKIGQAISENMEITRARADSQVKMMEKVAEMAAEKVVENVTPHARKIGFDLRNTQERPA